ncbi:MAG: hypothetical protein K0U41_01570 [Gammaproteobacteria bacterium]|nr:hypothetical protein [Gammaproteobacteria bacterium]
MNNKQNSPLILSDTTIKECYEKIKSFHAKFLAKYGVTMPKLFGAQNEYTKDALVLVYLFQGYPDTRIVTKQELTAFIRKYYPNVTDVQQARHLGAQKGWWVAAGGRDNIVVRLKRGQYKLHSLDKPFPNFTQGHRTSDTGDWEEIKKNSNFRCVTCGSEEGQPHLHWPSAETKLQKAHKDPHKPLVAGNIIPQCQKCNRADRNRWVYDDKGRVVKLADANIITGFNPEVRKKMYEILYNEFKGNKPK